MTLKLRCDQLRKVNTKLSSCSSWQDKLQTFLKNISEISDRGLLFRIKYNIPIFVCLMSLLSCGNWTNAARYENYSV